MENIMVQLCSALEAIHKLGIVHRDVKPSNILLCGDGKIKLIDFEAARIFKDDSDNDTCYLGTRGYAPPEQYGFAQTDFRADIYAAGQTMKALFGELSEKPRYKRIIAHCTELDPDKRYKNAAELKSAVLNIRRNTVLVPILSTAAVLAFAVCIFVGVRSANGEPAYTETETELPQTVTASSTMTEAVQTSAETAKTETESRTEPETETAETTLVTETGAGETQTSASTTEFTTASGYIIGNEISYPTFSEEKITYATDPENIPEYSDDDMIFFCEDTGCRTRRHRCQKHTKTKNCFIQWQETAYNINDRRNNDQSVYGIFYNCPVPEIFEINVRKDHTNDHHRHCGVAVPNCRYCTVKSKWQWKSRNHQNNSENTCQDARMCHNLFQSFLFVTGSGKNSQSGGPHHDSLWDQINAGKHQTFCTINSLRNRISKEARI